MIKAGATRTATLLFKCKQHAAGERVLLLDDFDFPGRTVSEKKNVIFLTRLRRDYLKGLSLSFKGHTTTREYGFSSS